MIVLKTWLQRRRVNGDGIVEWARQGWYLFGFIPLFIRDCQPRGRYGC